MIVNEASSTMSFGIRLAGERRRLGITQAALGKFLGVKKHTQWQYENDKTVPDARYLIAARDLGVDVVYVLFDRVASVPGSSDGAANSTALPLRDDSSHGAEEGAASPIERARDRTLLARFRNLKPEDRDAFLHLLSVVLQSRQR